MTDNELLLAISEMLDKKLEPMKKDIQNIKSKVKMILGEELWSFHVSKSRERKKAFIYGTNHL